MLKKLFAGVGLALLSLSAGASCSHLYDKSIASTEAKTVELCNDFFVVRYHVRSKAALYTMEKLTAGTPVGTLSRINSFHWDSRVPSSPYPSAYAYTGYDRGHMVASDDAYTATGMYQTFAMTNMTPQDPTLNRGPWARLEQKIRDQFRADNRDYYVTTVAVYTKPLKLVGSAKVPVPSGYWKIVNNGVAKVGYYADNLPMASIRTYSYADFTTIINNSLQALE